MFNFLFYLIVLYSVCSPPFCICLFNMFSLVNCNDDIAMFHTSRQIICQKLLTHTGTGAVNVLSLYHNDRQKYLAAILGKARGASYRDAYNMSNVDEHL